MFPRLRNPLTKKIKGLLLGETKSYVILLENVKSEVFAGGWATTYVIRNKETLVAEIIDSRYPFAVNAMINLQAALDVAEGTVAVPPQGGGNAA
jgi:hypothetical protein